MQPQQALDAIVRALQQSSRFSAADYITDDPDFSNTNNRLSSPFVAAQPVGTVRVDSMNSDRVGYITDDNDNRTGSIYEAPFDMDVQLDIYVAAGDDDHDATALGGDLRDALYVYDAGGPDRQFPDGNGGTLSEVRHFDVGSGLRADDLSGPGIRRWRHESEIRFVSHVEITSDSDPFTTIDTPTDADLDAPDGDAVEFEYTIT